MDMTTDLMVSSEFKARLYQLKFAIGFSECKR